MILVAVGFGFFCLIGTIILLVAPILLRWEKKDD